MHAIIRTVIVSLLLLASVVPISAKMASTALAEELDGNGSWYRYQGEPSSYDSHSNQNVNCGPTSVAMAIQYTQNLSVPIRDIRDFIGKNKKSTNLSDLTKALNHWNVSYRANIYNVNDIKAALQRGHIIIVALDMRAISPGVDLNGASTDPSIRIGRFESVAREHWIVIKGITPDENYFIVYDGNVWGGPGNPVYWYSDGTPKGMDRYYAVNEVEKGMLHFGTNTIKGIEILSSRGQDRTLRSTVIAKVTYYTLSPEETGKNPGDAGWGIMRNGKRIHWGAVAVDPNYIPLGTKMLIDGWGDQVFVASDTGSQVKGWHVDIYWPGSREEAFRKNDELGGWRKITFVGIDTPVSTSATTPPVNAYIKAPETTTTRWINLQLHAEDPEEGVVGMMISNSKDFTDAFEEPYSPSKEWTLPPGDGEKMVYARFKNSDGAWSSVVGTRIHLEEEPPTGAVTLAPKPGLVSYIPFNGSIMAVIGSQPKISGPVRYASMNNNELSNSSFELWAGGIPKDWDSPLRDESYAAYEPSTEALDGSTSLFSNSTKDGYIYQIVPVRANTSYTLSIMAKGNKGAIQIQELQTTSTTSRVLKSHTVGFKYAPDWKELKIQFKTQAETTNALVKLWGKNTYWDNIQLVGGVKSTNYLPEGLLIEGSSRNYIKNPSGELGPEGWSGINSWVDITSTREYTFFGYKALRVRKVKPGPAATIIAANLIPGKTYTLSAYLKLEDQRPVDSSIIRGWFFEGIDTVDQLDLSQVTDMNRPVMQWEPVGGGWYRGHFTFVARHNKGLYGVMSTDRIPVGGIYYMDGVQLEESDDPSTYFDGNSGPGYKWSGKPYYSSSHRESTKVIVGETENSTGTVFFKARSLDSYKTISNATILKIGQLYIQQGSNRLLFKWRDKLIGAAPLDTHPRAYAVTWSSYGITVYSSGEEIGSVAAHGPRKGRLVEITPSQDTKAIVISEFSLWKSVLTKENLRFLSSHRSIDPGVSFTVDPKTRIWVAAQDPTNKDLRILWSLDGIHWQNWNKGLGPSPWNLGGAKGLKTVWIKVVDPIGNWMMYKDEIYLGKEG